MEGRSRLLVIDDDPTIHVLLGEQLNSAGYDVHVASDGVEGLSATRDLQPDLVLCDWVMPRLDGLGYCRSIKSDPELKSTYVALLTSRAEAGDLIAGLDAGADDFLTKPVDLDQLLARVRAGLRVREMQQSYADAQHRAALLQMAVTLGDEINNPLTALFGHLELILQYMEQGDSERMLAHIRKAGDVGQRIAEVAQQLISLRDPQTKPYLGNLRMLDLERS